jgi:antitoxin component HigA of HigAB toxin-antitoxin module
MGSEKPFEVTSFRLDAPEDAELVKQLDGPPGIAVKALGQLWDRYGVVRRDSASVVLGRKVEIQVDVEAPPTEILSEVETSSEQREIIDFEEEWGGSNGSSYASRDN